MISFTVHNTDNEVKPYLIFSVKYVLKYITLTNIPAQSLNTRQVIGINSKPLFIRAYNELDFFRL